MHLRTAPAVAGDAAAVVSPCQDFISFSSARGTAASAGEGGTAAVVASTPEDLFSSSCVSNLATTGRAGVVAVAVVPPAVVLASAPFTAVESPPLLDVRGSFAVSTSGARISGSAGLAACLPRWLEASSIVGLRDTRRKIERPWKGGIGGGGSRRVDGGCLQFSAEK